MLPASPAALSTGIDTRTRPPESDRAPHQAERIVFEKHGINPVWMAGPEEIRMKACDAHGDIGIIAIKGTNLFVEGERQSLWNALKSKACFLV